MSFHCLFGGLISNVAIATSSQQSVSRLFCRLAGCQPTGPPVTEQLTTENGVCCTAVQQSTAVIAACLLLAPLLPELLLLLLHLPPPAMQGQDRPGTPAAIVGSIDAPAVSYDCLQSTQTLQGQVAVTFCSVA